MNTILQTTLVFTIISAVFAFILTLANRTIGNYGEVKLTINDEKEYTIEGGNSLLSSLTENEVFIPSACGGRGTCGYCKVQIMEGGGPVLATEKPFLTQEEEENHYRLSCQCKVKEDIKIQIPEELFNVKEYVTVVEEMEDVTDRIKRIKLRLPEGAEINFKAGQYIQLLAPEYEESDEEVFRAYSIASAAEDHTHIELFIGYVPGGIATTYVHKYLKVGDDLTITGPYGDFYYQDNDREMILAGAGTGIAPLLSLVRHLEAINSDRKATLYFGARTPDDLIMVDYFEEMEKKLPNFKFIPTLSRVTEEHNWHGEEGRVNNTLEKYMTSGENAEAYLCGNPAMIASIKEVLKEKGMPEELVYFDEF